ncbi:hypothetical protein BDV37DRAFT_258444 [Aspergillus pseudonomiae]|uniref:Uncharacterized protein n=1 Tax=Aspergillus pseudonomiae TaxID=1506151 RepID=A0A5N7D2N9_9EURO|nr:uncharacterized protein BDV37DRAFT_258444 [Aspergillus pseudonomiae]KAE8400143.1 hypothetical protein BDV37DRAFT_258444 [Aspergillus pseudonomiae]
MGPCLRPRPPGSDHRPSGLAGGQREARVGERPARQRSLAQGFFGWRSMILLSRN